MVTNGCNGCNGYKWLQMDANGYKWLQMVTNGYKWLQMVTNGYKFNKSGMYLQEVAVPPDTIWVFCKQQPNIVAQMDVHYSNSTQELLIASFLEICKLQFHNSKLPVPLRIWILLLFCDTKYYPNKHKVRVVFLIWRF